jgi:hypothetical protein
MPVIGINIKSIEASKQEEVAGSMKVNSNTNIKDIKEQELPAIKQRGLAITFEFRTEYLNEKSKAVAQVVIGGDAFFIDDQMDKIVRDWKKDKKLPEDVNLQILNAILRKAIVKALNLSEELQLPPPIALPFASKKQEEPNRYIG